MTRSNVAEFGCEVDGDIVTKPVAEQETHGDLSDLPRPGSLTQKQREAWLSVIRRKYPGLVEIQQVDWRALAYELGAALEDFVEGMGICAGSPRPLVDTREALEKLRCLNFVGNTNEESLL